MTAKPADISTEPATARLLEGYTPEAGVFDELMGRDGGLKPAYIPLLEALGRHTPEDLQRRWETGRRIIHEQGITYNVYGDPRGMERPWQMDPIPFVIGHQEWQSLEKALIQRATLINKILADCYGPQTLIRSGWLPPALVFGQPDFLRPCHGLRPPNDNFLHLYAADLARSPDGQWWVISDRTQIPTGAGYALANRLVTSRVLPEPFRDCHVQRLAGFFRALQGTLAGMASRRTDNPRVVLLTPGPYNETYFEQAWLARYLGYALVEGQDLTVRDDRVFLKTLSGLEPVDVILRRVDDEFCDPLDLRNDSMLGVPGLVEALRAGNVSVANALGTGILQSPAFLSFLPGLSRQILGEDLKLPSVATWWCGQKSAQSYVLENLDDLFVKPAFRTHLKGSDPERRLEGAARAALEKQIRFQPHLFVGQERVRFATAPSWNGESLSARPVGLRVYLVATKDGYQVMPGGLTRLAPSANGRFISMQKGGSSKDTWILSEEPVDEVTLLQTSSQEVELRRVGNNLPSRMADNFFWLGRYSERCDATARLLRSTLLRFNPESAGSAAPLLEPLLITLFKQGQIGALEDQPELRSNPAALEAELLAAIFDPERRSSLRGITDNLQRLAMVIRDRTSNDLWRSVSQLGDKLATSTANLAMLPGDAVGVINQLLLGIAAFHGIARENMTRAQGWRFLDMGMRIERAIYLCNFLDSTLRSPEADNPSVLEAVLEVADSTITFRSRYNLMPNIAAVYDLVMLDDTNPRSLRFQLDQMSKHVERLPQQKDNALPSETQRVLLQCLTRLRLMDPRPLSRQTGDWHKSEVGAVLQDVIDAMPKLSDAIAVNYFAHSAISRAGGS